MPDAAPPVNRFRRSFARSNNHAAVLTSSNCFRHFNSGSFAVLFLPDTLTRSMRNEANAKSEVRFGKTRRIKAEESAENLL